MKKIIVLIAVFLLSMFSFVIVSCSGGGKEKMPGFDEGGFGGSSNTENIPLETDEFIQIDGELTEDCWQNKKWFSYQYEGVSVSVTTTFSDLGFYVAFKVLDSHVYACDGRMAWMGSSVEMYMDRSDATLRSPQTVQYRLSVLDQAEILNGYATPEDNWSWKYLPIYGRTKVNGVINSGNTEGVDAEIFVRWDSLGYDYEAEDFTAPEQVKLFAVYNQSSGPDMTSPRDWWVNNGGNINNPIEYWLFDTEGFTNADAEGSVIGDASFGRAKSTGWDLTGLNDGKFSSNVSGEQTIYFRDIYAEDYAFTTLMQFKKALPYWNNGEFVEDKFPKAGVILGGDKTLQAFLVDYEANKRTPDKASGVFFNRGNPDPRDLWELSSSYSAQGIFDPAQSVRLTAVKKGKYFLVYAGDGNAEKYQGTFIGMIEDSLLSGKATPGFFTLGCEVEFSDYEVTTDSEKIGSITDGVLSMLQINNVKGGSVSSDATGYKFGETAELVVRTNVGYRLTSLMVNGVEKRGDIVDGVLTIEMDKSVVTVDPVYERISGNKYDVNGKVVAGTGHVDFSFFEVLVTDNQGIYNRYQLNNDGTLAMSLPQGEFDAYFYMSGNLKKTVHFEVVDQSVDFGEIVVDGNIEFNNNSDISYNSDGSINITGENNNRTIKGAVATDSYFIETNLERNDGNFIVQGTWATGGIVIKINEKHYRIYVMRENADVIVVYINKHEEYEKTVELRANYKYQGTGAPIKVMLAFVNGKLELLLDGKLHMTITEASLGANAGAYSDLFSTETQKEIGLMVIDKVEGGIKFSNVSYGTTAEQTNAKLDEVAYKVTIDQNEGGSIVVDNERVFAGDSAQLTIQVNDGYVLKSLLVNDDEKITEIVDGKYVINDIRENIRVEAVFEEVTFRTVSGTFGYAEGLFSDGDEVKVSSGALVGTVSGNTFSIQLPEGENTITLSSKYYQNATITVTVGDSDISDLKATFSYVKFDNNNGDIVYGEDGSLTVSGAHNFKPVAGVTADKNFVFTTTLSRTDGHNDVSGYWSTAGVAIKAGDVVYRIFPMKENGGLVLWFNINGNDSVKNELYRTSYAGTGSEITLTIAFTGDNLYVMANGEVVICLNYDNTASEHNTLRALFEDNGPKTFGVTTIDASDDVSSGISYKFWNVSYVLGSQGTANAIEEMHHFITVNTPENGTVSVVDKVMKGQDAVVSVAPDKDYKLSVFKVNGQDKLSEVVNGEYTLSYINEDMDIEVQFVYAPEKFTVTGSFDYADGLFAEGDTVTVRSGSYEGVVDMGEKTYTIDVQSGDVEIILTSTRFQDAIVRLQVEDDTTADPAIFRYVKTEDNPNVQYLEEGKINIRQEWQNAMFANFKPTGGFEVSMSYANSDRGSWTTGGGWGCGAIAVKADKVYYIHLMNEGDGLVVYLNSKDVNAEYRQGGSILATGASVKVDFAFLNGEATLIIDNSIKYVLRKDNAKTYGGETVSVNEALNGFFDYQGERSVGIANVASTATDFFNIEYREITALDGKYTLVNSDKFVENDHAFAIENGALIARNSSAILKDASVTGSFKLSFHSERADDYFIEQGTWDNGGIYIKSGAQSYKIFLMRENATSTVLYLVIDGGEAIELRGITTELKGTGAPMDMTLYFDAANANYILMWDSVVTKFDKDTVNSEAFNDLFDAGLTKEVGLYGHAATEFTNINFSSDAEEINSEISSITDFTEVKR